MKSLLFLSIALVLPSAFAGIHGTSLWDKHDVSVCFAAGEAEKRDFGGRRFPIKNWPQKKKEAVQRWVESEFTPQRTGIHFLGWKDCAQDPDADIILFYSKRLPFIGQYIDGARGLAYVGVLPLGYVKGYPLARGAVWLGSSGFNKATTIHEFGHASGLHHEHQHPEARSKQPWCLDTRAQPLQPGPYIVVREFDPHSVMSYCALNNSFRSGLSGGDLNLLKSLYP